LSSSIFIIIIIIIIILSVFPFTASSGDGPLTNSKPIAHFHRSMADRIAAAKRFIEDCQFCGEVVCDTMANEVVHRYDAHPERILVIEKGMVVHKGGKGPIIFYDIEDIIEWLRQRDHRSPSDIPSYVSDTEGECST
jgi:hypothetical protein